MPAKTTINALRRRQRIPGRQPSHKELPRLSTHVLEKCIQALREPKLKALVDRASPFVEEWYERQNERATLTPLEKGERLGHFLRPGDKRATHALRDAIKRLQVANPSLSYAEAFKATARSEPDLAIGYLVEARGALPLPPWPRQYDHSRTPLAEAWADAERIYSTISAPVRSATVPPVTLRFFLARWEPVYFAYTGGERQFAKHHCGAQPDPPYGSAPLLHVALNLDFSREDILQALKTLLRRVPKELRRRRRYTAVDVAQIIVWYYKSQAGVPRKQLAAEAASVVQRPRRTRRGAKPDTEQAVKQALARIDAGLTWLKSLLNLPAQDATRPRSSN